MGKKRKLIKIKNESEFQSYLSKGYKIVNNFNRFGFTNDGKGSIIPDYNYGYIFLEKDGEELIVNCSDLGMLFASQYSQVADIDGTFFAKVTNQNEKMDIEQYTYDFFDNIRRKPCVQVETLNSTQPEKIIQFLREFVNSEIYNYSKNLLDKKLLNIFANVIIITEKKGKVDCEIFEKQNFTIPKMDELRKKAKIMQNCFSFSFFYIYSKSKKSEYNWDIFPGCVLYDIKNQKTVSFSLTSTFEEGELTQLKGKSLFIHCCKKLFDSSIQKLNFVSIMHVSILHSTYTPLPWIFFSTLYEFQYLVTENRNSEFFISIPEFFCFGISKDIQKEDSFYYSNITKEKHGSAVIRFDFMNNKKIDYQLRFDVSQGEKFLHIDYGYHLEKSKMIKLVSHFPIDMELVKNFNKRLFVAIMSSGFYDPEFAGILKSRLKNITEIMKKYKELSEPLKIMHNSDMKEKWLEENQLCEEYVKIFQNGKGIDNKKYIKISNQFSGLFGKDKNGVTGFSHEGLMVLVRKFKGKDPKLYFIKNYLTKSSPRKK